TITYLSDIGCLEIQGASLRTINTQLSHTDWQRKCFQEQVICHGKANQKYRLILVFKPFLLVSMIQRLSKKLGNSTTLGNYGLCPAALI
ncbi:hypothetical protein, partial [Escherichia coli]|uniref:hypothetical protein n=1 Tax=Escherichia coli TaxID=562 RepID=UPI001BD4D7F1